MDDISAFIGKLETELEIETKGALKPETIYREIPNWSSMFALVIIALSETEYDVTLTGEDLRKCTSVNDLYSLIKSRKS